MNTPQPPSWAIRFLEKFCPPSLAESILGDLYEEFEDDLSFCSEAKARRRFVWNVFRFFRPGILLRNHYSYTLFNNNMWSNYFKIAGRNLLKRKMYSTINAVGLSIGIAFCILIFLFIRDEKSFDTFHKNKESIFRVEEKAYDVWEPDPENPYYYSAWLQAGLRNAVLDEIPQVDYATSFSNYGEVAINYKDQVFSENLTFVDQDFFSMFSFSSISGDQNQYLTELHHAVIPESYAQRIFGEEDPLDKIITIVLNGEKKNMTVSGVIEDAPTNSSLDYGILILPSNRSHYVMNLDKWYNFNTPLFIQLQENSGPEEVQAQLSTIVDKYMGESLAKRKLEYNIPDETVMFEYQLTNIEDIHLDTTISWTRSSDPKFTYILGGIALFILIIACINYVSLALTSSAGRSLEVGIRKAIGANRNQLLTQFSVEAIVLALLSLILALALVSVFLPSFNAFTDKNIRIDGMTALFMIGTGLGITMIIGLLSGSYPSLFLSGLNPIKVLKRIGTRVNAGFTKPLVVIQYGLSGILIISSIIMLKQMNFITTRDLGYNQDQVVVVHTNQKFDESANRFIEQFRQKVAPYGEIESVTGTTSSFNNGYSLNGYMIDGEQKSAYVYAVDPYYIPSLNIQLLQGTNFTASDSNALIVNEALVKDMGWENPLEEFLNWREDSLSAGARIIGVVKDYHFLSLEQKIEPMFLTLSSDDTGYLTTMLVRIASDNIPEAMEILRTSWVELAPDKPFDYSFLNEDVARQYEQYDRWTSIMTLSTFFAILISCLGLFGLAGINAVNRTKEIGIRKVMGAEIWNIFMLMNRQFILLVVISFIFAAPLSWWLMTQWLEGFTYSVTIGWDVFVLSCVIGLIVALLTVSYHSIKATRINPADTLKCE
jgi:putative ABC transport system permease protein